MTLPSYPPEQAKRLRAWLVFAVTTVIFAEVFAFFLAASRTPGVHRFLPTNFFHIALVVHVNLSLAMWFTIFQAFLNDLSLVQARAEAGLAGSLSKLGKNLAMAGVAGLVVAPFLGAGSPIMSNYVPVLDDAKFFVPMGVFALGISLSFLVQFLLAAQGSQALDEHLALGMRFAALTFFMALVVLVQTYLYLEPQSKPDFYYEKLFWGFGHLFQYVNSLAMLSCWLFLGKDYIQPYFLSDRLIRFLLVLIPLFALPALSFVYLWNPVSLESTDAFTFLMRWGLGLTTLVIGGGTLLKLPYSKAKFGDPIFASLVLSISLFALGGVLGATISHYSPTVKTPSHYHAVIGAVTLVFMGMFYRLLPLLERPFALTKKMKWQPFLCGAGGFLFVLGMYGAGLFSVARKVTGEEQVMDKLPKILGMSLMGTGGLITLVGTLMFIWIFFRILQGKSA